MEKLIKRLSQEMSKLEVDYVKELFECTKGVKPFCMDYFFKVKRLEPKYCYTSPTRTVALGNVKRVNGVSYVSNNFNKNTKLPPSGTVRICKNIEVYDLDSVNSALMLNKSKYKTDDIVETAVYTLNQSESNNVLTTFTRGGKKCIELVLRHEINERFKTVVLHTSVNEDFFIELKNLMNTLNQKELDILKGTNLIVDKITKSCSAFYRKDLKSITISPATLSSLIHELGHAIDYTNNITGNNAFTLKDKSGLAMEIVSNFGDRRYIQYLLQDVELFARSYEVYKDHQVKDSIVKAYLKENCLEEINSYFDKLLK